MKKFGRPITAIVVMGAIIAVLMTLCTPRSTSKSTIDGGASAVPRP